MQEINTKEIEQLQKEMIEKQMIDEIERHAKAIPIFRHWSIDFEFTLRNFVLGVQWQKRTGGFIDLFIYPFPGICVCVYLER